MDEVLDIYDDNKKKTGMSILRSKTQELSEGKHILISVLLVENDEGKIMMQLTSPKKGSVFALPGGHVLQNENSRDTIIREMYEEQGLVIKKDGIELIEERMTNKLPFFHIYYQKQNYDINKMLLQEDEVEKVMWMSKEEILLANEEGRVRASSYETIKNFYKL